VTNSGQNVAWSTTYQPFGTTAIPVGSISQNLRFPGQYFDGETGFNYNLNRDYMPNLGRYLETDPIGLAGGINPYLYAAGNPIAKSDETGLYQPEFYPNGQVVQFIRNGVGAEFQPGYILADDGTVISVFKNVSNFIETGIQRYYNRDFGANCIGQALTNSEYFIDPSQAAKLLAGDGYIQLNGPVDGAIAIYTSGDQIVHAAIVQIDSNTSDISVISKNGTQLPVQVPVDKTGFGNSPTYWIKP
jgi:RHS repeat-associated protein